MTTAAVLVAGLVVLVGLGLRAWRRRTVFLPLRMSDAWLAAHAADPAPDHLQ